ncbi:MAG: hypothetical protein Q4C34_00790 [Bacteroidales bacterium]|nr:hypothetical protein [Bacteroidales bacterium]
MSKFLLLSSAIALAVSAQAASPVTMHSLHHNRLGIHKASQHEAAKANELWRAGTEKIFDWTGRKWEASSVNSYTYDSEGHVLTHVSAPAEGNDWDEYSRTTNTYDANGMRTTQLTETSADGTVWTKSEIIERKYDPIVKSLIIDNNQGFWTGVEWNYSGNTYRRIVERNAQGSITSVEVQTMYGNAYEAVQRFTVKYGADGRATEVEERVLTLDNNFQPVWGDGEKYTDIVWDRTDGQLTSISDLTSVNNRIKSATYWSEGDRIGPVSATYPDDKGSYNLVLDLPDEGIRSTESLRIIDDNGSAEFNLTTVSATEGTMVSTEKYHYDAYGLETLIYSSETADGVEEIFDWLKGEVVYDSTTAYPLEYTLSALDLETDQWQPLTHSVFDDYVNVAAGIRDINTDATDTPAEYYDLRGIRITEPSAPGIYIRRQGNTTDKIIIR